MQAKGMPLKLSLILCTSSCGLNDAFVTRASGMGILAPNTFQVHILQVQILRRLIIPTERGRLGYMRGMTQRIHDKIEPS
jgi:hypothetical protein